MEGKTRFITDLGAAAYILMHEYKIAGKKARELYFLVDEDENHSEDKFDELYRDYLASEYHRFDSCIMSLKKISEGKFDIKEYRYVTDLGAAAYLLMHKFKVVGRKSRSIYFDVDENSLDEFDKTYFEYISSNYHRFDSCLMSLKKVSEYIPN